MGEGSISMGPWGGQEGEQWAYKQDDGRITQIIVRHGGAIDSLSFKSESCDGFPLEPSQKIGGPGGDRTDKVCIDGIDEYLTNISMTLGPVDFGGGQVGFFTNGESVVRSLSFHTNLTQYGPFGYSKSGPLVSVPMEGGVIIGFHGRAGKYLDAIGIYVAPKITSHSGSQLSAPTHSKALRSLDELDQRDPGPWGAQRGRQWDDGVFLAVKKVNLRTNSEYGHAGIHAIQFTYEQRDGSSFTSPWHGSTHPGGRHLGIELDSASGEVIDAIEGFYGPAKGTDGFEIITSISIYTNMRMYGPFGENEICTKKRMFGGNEKGTGNGKHFSSILSDGKVVGFFGRSGTCLNAIGVHTEYC